MTRWPVFVWRVMHEDAGHAVSLNQMVRWDVSMIDGAANGWPTELLVETDVEIVALDDVTRPTLLAHTDGLAVCWGGASPAGSRFRIRAGLVADFLNPPVSTPVEGIVRSIYLAIPDEPVPGPDLDLDGPGWSLMALNDAPPSLAPYTDVYSAGLLVELDLSYGLASPSIE
jgi:hypothetical protein